MKRTALAISAGLEMPPDSDSRAPGGAVTKALCGHWEHEGSCRWPHHSRIEVVGAQAQLRVVFVADDESTDEVVERVHSALSEDLRWGLTHFALGSISQDEGELAHSLARTE